MTSKHGNRYKDLQNINNFETSSQNMEDPLKTQKSFQMSSEYKSIFQKSFKPRRRPTKCFVNIKLCKVYETQNWVGFKTWNTFKRPLKHRKVFPAVNDF